MAHILVIDDDELVLQFLCGAMDIFGHEVTSAMDGKTGVQLYRQNDIDLVITDIQMPKMDGVEVIRTLRQDDPNVKIIACTGYDPSHLIRAEEAGASATCTKPLDMSDLRKTIDILLESES